MYKQINILFFISALLSAPQSVCCEDKSINNAKFIKGIPKPGIDETRTIIHLHKQELPTTNEDVYRFITKEEPKNISIRHIMLEINTGNYILKKDVLDVRKTLNKGICQILQSFKRVDPRFPKPLIFKILGYALPDEFNGNLIIKTPNFSSINGVLLPGEKLETLNTINYQINAFFILSANIVEELPCEYGSVHMPKPRKIERI